MARKLIVPTVLLAALAAGVAVAVAATRVQVVATASNSTLGRTVLVTRSGRTLYSLSAEKHGRFICTNKVCLSFWTPLVVKKGSTPTGTARLGTIRRPDGGVQVTYKGLPLYTFDEDRAKGDAKGEGFRDVGVWHAAVVGPASSSTTTSVPTTATTGGTGGGYYPGG